jgi:uncharacterized membrane protein
MPPKSKLPVVLGLSLALNCLLAGFLIGRGVGVIHPSGGGPAGGPPVANGFGERLKQLPGEERQKFQKAMQPSRPAIKAAREDLAAARHRLAEAMAADPYDADKVRDAFADVRAKTQVLQSRVQDATAQALASLSPDLRKRLAGP